MLRDFGAGYLNKVVTVRLAGWLDYCQGRLANYYGGIVLVDVFMSVLQQIRQLLDYITYTGGQQFVGCKGDYSRALGPSWEYK